MWRIVQSGREQNVGCDDQFSNCTWIANVLFVGLFPVFGWNNWHDRVFASTGWIYWKRQLQVGAKYRSQRSNVCRWSFFSSTSFIVLSFEDTISQVEFRDRLLWPGNSRSLEVPQTRGENLETRVCEGSTRGANKAPCVFLFFSIFGRLTSSESWGRSPV